MPPLPYRGLAGSDTGGPSTNMTPLKSGVRLASLARGPTSLRMGTRLHLPLPPSVFLGRKSTKPDNTAMRKPPL